MSVEYFTVDAALLQELGERLIGRSHIALAELIKNSYDADANTARLIIARDRIEVIDDGHGMTLNEFRDFWLRLGTQHKREEGQSPLGRPFAGSKGVGRLAVQFLARNLSLWTTAERPRGSPTLKASVDWSTIRSGGTLREVPVRVVEIPREEMPVYPNRRRHGTHLVLSNLHDKDWDEKKLGEVGDELWNLRSPFVALRGQRSERRDPNFFDVELEAPGGDEAKQRFDRVLGLLTGSLWRARITGRVENGRQSDRAEISVEFRDDFPSGARAQTYREEVTLSSLGDDEVPPAGKALLEGVEYVIHVYQLVGRQPDQVRVDELRDYLSRFGNVSIYDTGFRLPYYGMEHDWADIGRDQGRRITKSGLLDPKWEVDRRYLLDLPDPRRIFGAVEINTNLELSAARRAKAKPGEYLLIQSSRDRLHPNPAYLQLRNLVRYGLDLYANRYNARAIGAVEDVRGVEPASEKYSRVRRLLQKYRTVIPAEVQAELVQEVGDAEEASRSSEVVQEARLFVLAPLASAGITALGLSHELARETRALERARQKLETLARRHELPELQELAEELGQATMRLRSVQTLFSPMLVQDDREGTHRLRAATIAKQVVDGMAPMTAGLEVVIDVPDDLRFPPGPLASWSAILQNLIANAWNAVLDAGEARVLIEGGVEGGTAWLSMSDTGVGLGVSIEEAEKYFGVFERGLRIDPSRTSVAIGGTGMGLAIVRMICRRHQVEVDFVEPDEGLSTSIQLTWKA